MAKQMTKAQLVDENIALRHNIDLLERRSAELSTQQRSAPQRSTESEDIVATYTKRDGTRWNKVRIGYNMYAHRQVVSRFYVEAGKYDGGEENCKYISEDFNSEAGAEAHRVAAVADYPWSRVRAY